MEKELVAVIPTSDENTHVEIWKAPESDHIMLTIVEQRGTGLVGNMRMWAVSLEPLQAAYLQNVLAACSSVS